jgi:hypothetical protein
MQYSEHHACQNRQTNASVSNNYSNRSNTKRVAREKQMHRLSIALSHYINTTHAHSHKSSQLKKKKNNHKTNNHFQNKHCFSYVGKMKISTDRCLRVVSQESLSTRQQEEHVDATSCNIMIATEATGCFENLVNSSTVIVDITHSIHSIEYTRAFVFKLFH